MNTNTNYVVTRFWDIDVPVRASSLEEALAYYLSDEDYWFSVKTAAPLGVSPVVTKHPFRMEVTPQLNWGQEYLISQTVGVTVAILADSKEEALKKVIEMGIRISAPFDDGVAYASCWPSERAPEVEEGRST